MQFVIEQDPARQKDRSEFIKHSELAAIRMLEFSASRPANLPESDELQLTMKHHASPAASPDGHQLIHVGLQVQAITGEPPVDLVDAEVMFELDYALNDGYHPTPAHVEAFIEGNAVLHCWPYFREFVQSATQRMGLTVPPLPMIGLPDKPKPTRKRK